MKWTPRKIALIGLCMLVGAVCAYRAEDLERAGILTQEQGLWLAGGLISLALIWFGILYEINKRK